jgi:protein ImuA
MKPGAQCIWACESAVPIDSFERAKIIRTNSEHNDIMTHSTQPELDHLRHQLAALERRWQQDAPAHGHPVEEAGAGRTGAIPFGIAEIDEALNGGLLPGTLHEAWAASAADISTLGGFGGAIAQLLHNRLQRPVIWVRQGVAEAETGLLYAPGLISLGIDPAHLIVVRTKTLTQLLAAGLEAARCGAVAATIIEAWDIAGTLDLTAARRLSLASEKSGATTLLLRVCPTPPPSSAITRWHIEATPSQSLAGNAPGYPAFDITLQRNRNGRAGQRWRVEWNHDEKYFRQTQPLSRSGVPIPERRPSQMGGGTAAQIRSVDRPAQQRSRQATG